MKTNNSEKEVIDVTGMEGKELLDRLSIASLLFNKGRYQEAVDEYKTILLENPTYIALNYYIALCYAKLDYYEVALEMIERYQIKYSPLCINLKACCIYKTKGAAQTIKDIELNYGNNIWENNGDLLKHNYAIFKNNNGSIKVILYLNKLIINNIVITNNGK